VPLPLIPIAIGIATAASVGLQAVDTFKEQPITVQTYSRPASTATAQTASIPLAPILIFAAVILAVIMVAKS